MPRERRRQRHQYHHQLSTAILAQRASMQRSDASAVLPSEGPLPLPLLFWRKALAILLFWRTVAICQRHGDFGDEGHERCRPHEDNEGHVARGQETVEAHEGEYGGHDR